VPYKKACGVGCPAGFLINTRSTNNIEALMIALQKTLL